MKKQYIFFQYAILIAIYFFGQTFIVHAADKSRVSKNGFLNHIGTLQGANIFSPKSAVFSSDGSKFYINSLEGKKTVIYDSKNFQETGVIPHTFSAKDSKIFNDQDTIFDYIYNASSPNGANNCFDGKPVEFAISHDGKYLWVSYYRRSWDKNSNSPSAIAIIDTDSDKIVRVIPSGPIPKMLAVSPDGQTLAEVNWGDNTIGLIDISSPDPQNFFYKAHLVDGKRLGLANISGNRDSNCGYCLRGVTFSPDSRYLLVGRMHGGDISVFDTATGKRMGSISGIPATPRHMARSKDGKKLYVSSSKSGMISEIDLASALANLENSQNGRINANAKSIYVGKDPRTLVISPDEKYIFVSCNRDSQLVMVDREDWKVVDSIPVSPYAVGLAISPNEDLLITTSQGRSGVGGHKVDIYRFNRPK